MLFNRPNDRPILEASPVRDTIDLERIPFAILVHGG
jgi:hypothetical protein